MFYFYSHLYNFNKFDYALNKHRMRIYVLTLDVMKDYDGPWYAIACCI